MRGLTRNSVGTSSVRKPKACCTAGLYVGVEPKYDPSARAPTVSCKARETRHVSPR